MHNSGKGPSEQGQFWKGKVEKRTILNRKIWKMANRKRKHLKKDNSGKDKSKQH